jgi:hypothetical protein
MEVRPMGHGRWVSVTGAYSGLASWALHGLSADDLHVFKSPATLFLIVREDLDQPLSSAVPSSWKWEIAGVILLLVYIALLVVSDPEFGLLDLLVRLSPMVAMRLSVPQLKKAGRAILELGDASVPVPEPDGSSVPVPELGDASVPMPEPVNGPRYPMRPVARPLGEAEVMRATGLDRRNCAAGAEMAGPLAPWNRPAKGTPRKRTPRATWSSRCRPRPPSRARARAAVSRRLRSPSSTTWSCPPR